MGATLKKPAPNAVVDVIVEVIATTATTKTWGHLVAVNALCDHIDNHLYLCK